MKLKFSPLDYLISGLTGRAWNFHIVFVYRMDPDAPNSGTATRSMSFWTKNRNVLASYRSIKKMLVSTFVADLPKQYRKNGVLEIESITYIGWFIPKPASLPKTGKIGHKKKSMF